MDTTIGIGMLIIIFLAGWFPFQLREDIDKLDTQGVIQLQESEVKTMANKVEVNINDIRKVGVMLFDFNDDRVIVLMLSEQDSLTVVACTKEELQNIMKGSDYEP